MQHWLILKQYIKLHTNFLLRRQTSNERAEVSKQGNRLRKAD